MNEVQFTESKSLSIGMELELQLINADNFDLATTARELMLCVQNSEYKKNIKTEITQSMIETNTQIHDSPLEFIKELKDIFRFINKEAKNFKTLISGGGTHPFQFWPERKIFPTKRFREKSKEHGYLSKRYTIFSMHLHIGCKNSNDALYLTHVLTRYVPQFIALSASSPFYQNVYTGFYSTRGTIVDSHPFSGNMPFLLTWDEFSQYFNKLKSFGIIESMKDIYWGIRPKPEFGTVEIRVCDMPLTLHKAIAIAGYIQALARYLLLEKPHPITQELYLVYEYNRFRACHDAFDAEFINPYTAEKTILAQDIAQTLKVIKPHAEDLKTDQLLLEVAEWVAKKENDAGLLMEFYEKKENFEDVIAEQCKMWTKSI